MQAEQEFTIMSAPNRTGLHFVRQLRYRNSPFAVLVNDRDQREPLAQFGIEHAIHADTTSHDIQFIPDVPVGKVYLFEKNLPLCCRLIQICRSWTSRPLYVITHSDNPRTIYKMLGADHVIHTKSEDVSFLLTD